MTASVICDIKGKKARGCIVSHDIKSLDILEEGLAFGLHPTILRAYF